MSLDQRKERVTLSFIAFMTVALLALIPVFFFVIVNTQAGIGAIVAIVIHVVCVVLIRNGRRTLGAATFFTVDLLIVIGVGILTATSGEPYAPVAISVIGLILVFLLPTGLLVSRAYLLVMVGLTTIGFVASIFASEEAYLIQRVPVFVTVKLLFAAIAFTLTRLQARTFEDLDKQTAAQTQTLSDLESVVDRLCGLSDRSSSDHREIDIRVGSIRSVFDAYRDGVSNLNGSSRILSEESQHATSGLKELDQAVADIRSQASLQQEIVSQTAGEQSTLYESMGQLSGQVHRVQHALQDLDQDVTSGRATVSQAGDRMENLRQQRGELSASIKLISRIAAQTNLLAMNAAIEAAHAGDAGRGFAVVASEVRNLADESSRQSSAISRTIAEFAGAIDESASLVSEAGSVFESVQGAVNQSTPTIESLGRALGDYQEGLAEMQRSNSRIIESNEHLSQSANTGSDRIEAFRTLFERYDDVTREMLTVVGELEVQNAAADSTVREVDAIRERLDSLNGMIGALLETARSGCTDADEVA